MQEKIDHPSLIRYRMALNFAPLDSTLRNASSGQPFRFLETRKKLIKQI
jgi:hypothetical protein